MASIPEDLAAYLDPSISETAGEDLFEGPQPEKPDDLIAITHYAGGETPDRVMSPSLTAPGLEVTLVQVLVRNFVMATARTKVDAIHALLDNLNTTISGRTYFHVESINSVPFGIGQDKEGRWRFVCNYRIFHSR